MGFFDTIDRIKTEKTAAQITTDSTRRPGPAPQTSKETPVEHADFTKKKISFRRETLSFLRPCPLCGGRDMLFNKTGGFFCLDCQPEATGTPVKAGGPDRQHDPAAATIEGREYFMTAWSWIKNNLPELLASGWTRRELLGRSKYRYPLKWGIAWFSVWHQNGVIVTIAQNGKIVFSFQEQGKAKTLSASPPPARP